ncbi:MULTISPECIES: type II toxin-antitoxin system VapC family toxin [unclassified Okeania]|uniref:type II toxin-antitoxin system VapC family toxin n=1 Tax=unclassified Okeania TaxID=2634635 RepID=UPI0013C0C30B|nr:MULTISPECIES: PIN domain-containing protein [unclassified Okeania]NET26871.1 PIN domain-containing protein [Okeania sp. SIO1I7]NET41464.1 PIN domain-containing protein [Okeania sp. SIO2B3]
MKLNVILDTSPLVALIDKGDRFHNWTTEMWKTISLPLYTCEAVISETCFLLQNTYGGEDAVISLVKAGVIQISFALTEEVEAVGNLMKKYKSVPMSFADACLVRMSELIPGSSLLTLDSDFRIYRKNQTEVIDVIIPDEL